MNNKLLELFFQEGGVYGLIMFVVYVLLGIILKKVSFKKIGPKGFYLSLTLLTLIFLFALTFAFTSTKSEQIKRITGQVEFITIAGDTVEVTQAKIKIKQLPDIKLDTDSRGVYWAKLIGNSETTFDFVINHDLFNEYNQKEIVDFNSSQKTLTIDFYINSKVENRSTPVKKEKEEQLNFDYVVVSDDLRGLFLYTSEDNKVLLKNGTKLSLTKLFGNVLHVVADVKGVFIEGQMNTAVLEMQNGIGVQKIQPNIPSKDYKLDITHKIQMPNNMGLRFRTTTLSESQIREVNRGSNVYEESEVLGLESGQPVELIKTEGKWHLIRVEVSGKVFTGFISYKYGGKPTLIPVK